MKIAYILEKELLSYRDKPGNQKRKVFQNVGDDLASFANVAVANGDSEDQKHLL